MFQVISQKQFHDDCNAWGDFSRKFTHEAKGFFVEESATADSKVILFYEPKLGPIGGARLIKRSLSDFHPKAAQLIRRIFGSEEVWECNNVFFSIPDESEVHENLELFGNLCHQFYQGLYETLNNFAAAQKINSLITVNYQEEHADIEFFGNWPFSYELEVSSLFEDDADEYVVGVLALDSAHYAEFQNKKVSNLF